MTKNKNETQHTSVHLNCAQTVLMKYCEQYGLTKKLAIKLGTAFGGGIAGRGETCGAVTGALMVIGLKYGGATGDTKSDKKKNRIIETFLASFKSRYGSVRCKELLGYDISIPEDMEIIKAKNLFESRCLKFIHYSETILGKPLKE